MDFQKDVLEKYFADGLQVDVRELLLENETGFRTDAGICVEQEDYDKSVRRISKRANRLHSYNSNVIGYTSGQDSTINRIAFAESEEEITGILVLACIEELNRRHVLIRNAADFYYEMLGSMKESLGYGVNQIWHYKSHELVPYMCGRTRFSLSEEDCQDTDKLLSAIADDIRELCRKAIFLKVICKPTEESKVCLRSSVERALLHG